MKKKFRTGLALGIMVAGLTGMAHAGTITVTYTGDNVVDSLYLISGGSVQTISPGSNSADWKTADSAILQNLLPGHRYGLVWEGNNLNGLIPTNGNPWDGNPAAFLAQITGDLTGGPMYSGAGSSWSFSPAAAAAPPLDSNNFSTLLWTQISTEFGNNGGDNIWNSVNHGAVNGISSSADWIWSNGNDPYVYIMAQFMTNPAPVSEPSTMILFGTGLLGLAGLTIKRKG